MRILKIEEIKNQDGDEDFGMGLDGYVVATAKVTYKVLISSGQSCCESFGYFDTNDNSKDFVGAELLSVELVDKALNVKKLDELELSPEHMEYMEGGCIFVNFNTDKGTFQLAVYNRHNGYYGHDVLVLKERTMFKGRL